MAARKHIRLIERAVRKLDPEIEVSHDTHGGGHIRLHVACRGTKAAFTVSSSPSVPETTIRNAVRDVARHFHYPYRNPC